VKKLNKSLINAEQKRADIVQAALRLFLDSGLAATSMDDVATHAGVTKQTVYRYFPSKEQLFVAVMEKIRGDEPESYSFGDADPAHELDNFGRSFLAFHLTPAALSVYRLIISEGGQENLGQTFIKQGPNRRIKPLQDFLRDKFPNLEDVDFYAQMFVSMILAPRNRLLMQGKQRISLAKQETHVKNVVKLFLRGVQC